jgi:hypothetical protein
MAEQAAAVEQEEKLKRFRKNKMAQFWNGIKQEHDFFVVFSGNGGGRRRSTATNNGKNATPASTLFSSAPSDKKTSSAATTKRSTTSSSGGEGGGGSEPRRSSILTGEESMQQKLDTAEAHRAEAHRAEALQDLEEYAQQRRARPAQENSWRRESFSGTQSLKSVHLTLPLRTTQVREHCSQEHRSSLPVPVVPGHGRFLLRRGREPAQWSAVG